MSLLTKREQEEKRTRARCFNNLHDDIKKKFVKKGFGDFEDMNNWDTYWNYFRYKNNECSHAFNRVEESDSDSDEISISAFSRRPRKINAKKSSRSSSCKSKSLSTKKSKRKSPRRSTRKVLHKSKGKKASPRKSSRSTRKR